MKVRASRIYKHDLSDIIGIIKEHQEMERELDYSMLEAAYLKLYEEEIPAEMRNKLEKIFSQQDLEGLFYDTKEDEKANLQAALKAEEMYNKKVNKDNINNFIDHFRS